MMDKADQKTLLSTFLLQMSEAILAKARHAPDDWDGHELREFAADEFDRERTTLMREDRRRKRAYRNARACMP